MKKVANWAALQAALTPLPTSLAIVGSDEFDRFDAIERLELHTGLKRKKIAMQTLVQELQATSFFDDRCLFHVEVDARLKAKDQELLEKALLLQHSHLLLLSGSTLPKGFECDLLLEIPEVKPWEKEALLQKWLLDFLSKEGRAMQAKAVLLLAREFQHNRFQLKQELEKLFCYTALKKEITLQDVEAICVMESKPLIWHLSDALLQKNRALSLTYVAQLQDGDIHPLQLVRYFRGQFHEALKGGIKPKLKQAARLFKEAGLQDALEALDNLEVKLKNSDVDEQLQLELLVIQLT